MSRLERAFTETYGKEVPASRFPSRFPLPYKRERIQPPSTAIELPVM